MAKAKESELSKGFDSMFEIVKLIVNAVLDIGGDDSDLEHITKNANLRMEIAKLIVGTNNNTADTFTAFVDYITPSFLQLMESFSKVNAAFELGEFHGRVICKPVSREPRELEFVYVHMDRSVSTEEVLAEMDKRKLRPAILEELVAFAMAYPEEQRKYPIIGLGTYCIVGAYNRRFRAVPHLNENRDGRYLELNRDDYAWLDHYRFLAVRE